ncbi:AAA family ATPase [Niallia oryzisoli]|uniref:SF1B family DNA helicase RecD2 n=1 Tax=Niallia oryzisoli TaxID=1737571 RepID=UPI0037369E8D
MSEQLVVQGEVIKTIFMSNKKYSNPFSVFIIKIHTSSTPLDYDEITVQCNAPYPERNKPYNFYGQFIENEKYGLQFKAEYYVRELPATIEDTIDFLGSGMIRGVGPKKAELIVNALGENCIFDIIKEPAILKNIKGLKRINEEQVAEELIQHFAIHRFATFFKSINIHHHLGLKIFRTLGDSTIDSIKENPYILISLIDGIGFKRADKIAKNFNITGNNPKRIKGLITAVLYKLFEIEGSSYTNRKFLFLRLNKELEEMDELPIEYEDFDRCVNEMIKEKTHNDFGTIVEIGYRISLSSIIQQEMEICDLIISKTKQNAMSMSDNEYEKIVYHINRIENQFKEEIIPEFRFSKSQSMALVFSYLNKILMITGGAGSGKSTVINAILRLYSYCNNVRTIDDLFSRIKLLAPTGKAAKRLTEITHIDAFTIHRFIYKKGIELPDEPCLFIVDETSMIELGTVHKLLKLVRQQDTIIFIGDPMQLPAVGSGRFFCDVLDSKVIPTIHLSKVYRQSSGSNILKLANLIRNDEIHNADQYMTKLHDMNFFDRKDYPINKSLINALSVAQTKGIDIQDIQILSPMNNGIHGVKALNNMLQKSFIEGTLTQSKDNYMPTNYQNTEYSFYIGDRVIQLKNNGDKEVFNGDIGVIVDVWQDTAANEEGLLVQFDNIHTPIHYSTEELDELALAYCLSVHKAQGSEYKSVILILVSNNYKIITKNLLYTALTRAKESFIFFGDKEKFKNGLYRKPLYRCTSLKYLLRACINENKLIDNTTLNQYRNLLKKEAENDQLELVLNPS